MSRPYSVAMLHWFVTPLDLERIGGVVRVELSQLQQMAERGHRAILYGREVRGDHPQVRALGRYRFLGRVSHRASLLEFMMRARRADILHGTNMPALAWLKPDRALIHYHNSAENAPLRGYEQRLHRYQLAQYAFCSQYLRDDFLRRYPEIPITNCHVVLNGVDPAYFTPAVDRPSQYDGQKRLFFLGQWSPEKGIRVLLEAIRILEELRPKRDYRWIIGGSSRYWSVDPAAAHNVEQAIAKVAAERETVKILGEVKYSDLPGVLQTMDILVNPVVWQEPFGLVNVEAMAAGLPVVASAVGGISEVVESEVNGLLVPPGNAEALARAVNRLLDTPSLIETMSTAARETVVRNFTWERHGEALLEVYRLIVNRRRNARQAKH